jgi:hypothetical protein
MIHKIISKPFQLIFGVKPEKGFVAALVVLFFILLIGTAFYSFNEHWDTLDALYFCVVTLTTVGLTDLRPDNPAAKIFTIFYIFLGMGMGILIISLVAKTILNGTSRRLRQMDKLLEGIDSKLDNRMPDD